MELERIGDYVRLSARVLWPCVLCQRPTHCRGVYVPADDSRPTIYALCGDHPAGIETFLRVEAALSREAATRWN